MLVGIHQLHYLPWLRYFEKIARSDVFVVLDDIQFTKNDWQNRNKIKTASGTTVLTLPVEQHHQQRLDQVRIDHRVRWCRKHRDSIDQAYAKAPHYPEHRDWVHDVYARDWTMMNDLNRAMLEYFLDGLGINTRIAWSSELNVPGQATERLVNLIQAVGGTAYYSGAFALQVYLDKAQLDAAGIALEIQDWQAPVYPQLHGEFVPDLSIVDLLFNCGPDSLDLLLGRAP